MKTHFAHPYIIRPQHKVTVDLVGLGGTGSQVLTNLGRMNEALEAHGHPGLHVRAWDHDIVTPSNIGRQLYSSSDLMINKAIVSITRINRFFGYEWEAMPMEYTGESSSNILITCVDSAAARISIGNRITKKAIQNVHAAEKRYYWLDMGNLERTGQAVLGTLMTIDQPKGEKKTTAVLKTVVEMFPQLKTIKEVDQGPSCSLAEAIGRQDLYINSTVSQFGCGLLWKLFKDQKLSIQGCYVNLESFSVNPIKIN